MDKKGLYLATFTVIIMISFVIGLSIKKGYEFEKNKIVETGKIPDAALYFSLSEEETKLFVQKSVEYSSFNALKQLGNNGGILKNQNCEKIDGHVIWKDKCYFSDNLQGNFFDRFAGIFDEYTKEYGLDEITSEWKIDENNKLAIETKGIEELEYKNIKYGFELNNRYSLDYDFNDYTEILKKANECIKDEENKGIARNNLFEKCRDDKDFKWGIKVDDKYILFDVSKQYKNLGNVIVKFAIPHNQ